MLKKREWVYIQNPSQYNLSPCKCGNSDTQWSEYEKHLWCDKCNIDFIPEHYGVFPGPIGLQLSKVLGLCFDRIYLETNKYMKMDEDLGAYVEPITIKKILESNVIEGNIYNEKTKDFEKINIDYKDFNFKIIEELKDKVEIFIYIGIPNAEKFILTADKDGSFIQDKSYQDFVKIVTKSILEETLTKRNEKISKKL